MLSFPKEKIEWALFAGVEQEGPFVGIKTLFVVGNAPYEKICTELYKMSVKSIYFGAGGRFEYNPEVIRMLADSSNVIHRPRFITVESPVYDASLHKAMHKIDNDSWVIPYIWNGHVLHQGIDTIMNVNKIDYNIWAKVDTGKQVFIHRLEDTFVARLDIGYHEDTLLVQKEIA